jgi:putative phosphoribosyl transferase
LLTKEEGKIDEETRELRFNITLLANRLTAITDWLLLLKTPETQGNLTIGYFGASTGAAAALVAAAKQPDLIKAVVSRAGRADLAGSSYLKHVQAPTLLIVGSKDNTK